MAACECEDLSHPAPAVPSAAAATVVGAAAKVAGGPVTVATTRRIRLLYDVEAAALATEHAHGGLTVFGDGASLTVAGGTSVAIVERR